MSNLSNIVLSIQKIMRKDRGVDGDAQRIGQLSWMLFLKILDAKELEREFIQDGYVSAIPSHLQWRARAADDEGITGDKLVDFVNNTLFEELKNLESNEDNKMTYIVKSVFEDSFNYMKNGVLIRQVINKLDEIDFNKSSELHIFNDIYEKILNDLQTAGNAGEFYTPRAVTQFMVEMIDPQLGEKVLDPSCGTGGFLTGAIDHIRDNYVHTPQDEEILQGQIYGTELKQLPHLLATTNLILHGIETPSNLRHDDSLSQSIIGIGPSDMVDVIITNPPFGGQIAPGVLHNFPSQFQTKETASLFMVLIINLLKTRGRAAVVLPDGFLFADGVEARIKEKLLSDCNLHTIVRLPNNVFAPYATVATNLLFFEAGTPTREIRYYEHQLPEGQKTYNKTNPIKLSEFDAEKSRWNTREESDRAWKVSIEDITSRNRNLDVKNPNKIEEVVELDTQQIIADIEHKLLKAQDILAQLKTK